MILYGSGMGNGNVHAADPLPVIAVGGVIKGDRHVASDTPTATASAWRPSRHADRQVRLSARNDQFELQDRQPSARATGRVGLF